jgi:dihydroflavonol-4-reductase
MARILITGATGLIGFHLLKALNSGDSKLRILHRKTSDLNVLRGLIFEAAVGDLSDDEALQRAVKDCDAVYHLAAHVSMGKAGVEMMQRINVAGTAALVSAASKAGVKRFVNVSSVAAMGIAAQGQADEREVYNHPPGRPYMETKRDAEKAAHANSGLMTMISVRPSLVVGPGPFRRGMVATFVRRALRSGLPLAPRGGINVVDVEDVVGVLIEAMNSGQDNDRFLATGHNISTKSLMKTICKLTQTPGPALSVPGWLTLSASHAMQGWMNLGLPGQLPALPMRLAARVMHYDDSWTRQRLELDVPRSLESTLQKRIDWERSQK